MPRDEDKNLDTEHISGETADHGFKFQAEILFYLCLQIYHLGCDSYKLGFEVKEIDKLDDIIIDCTYNDRKFAFFIQAKHNTTRNEVFLANFFSPTKKGGSKKYWKKYNLRQFVEALMTPTVQKSMDEYKDHTQRYIIITNNSVKTDNVETIVETCEGFNDIFRKFLENESKIIKFGQAFMDEMQTIINTINDDAKNKTLHQLEPSFLLDKIVVLSNVPNFEDLEGLSDKFVKTIFANNHSDLMPRFLRQNVNDFIKPVNNKRKFINQTNFKEIIELSMQEVDLTRMTETFIQSIRFHVKFDKNIIEDFRDKLNGKKVIECVGSEKLTILKVYSALKSSEVKVFLLQLSMLNKSYEEYFKLPKSKIIIFIDCYKNHRNFLKYENVVLIIRKGFNIDAEDCVTVNKPSFEEFSQGSKKVFFRNKIKIQGYSVELSKIFSLIYRNAQISMDFIDDLAEEFTSKDKVVFGKKLTNKPDLYIMRNYSGNSKEDLNDQELLRNFCNLIIVAEPGMGKTSTTAKLAADFKSENPNFWTGVLFLSDCTKILNHFQTKEEWTDEDLITFITNEEQDQNFCKTFLQIYLMEATNSPVILFLDGFDEIYPQYSDIVLILIRKLQELNVRIFITTRSHCVATLEELENFSLVHMQMFKKFQRNIFIRRYIEMTYKDEDVEQAIAKINRVLTSEVFDDKFLGTPILLRMLTDICLKSENYALNIKNFTIYNIYNDIYEMSFDNYYTKERIDGTLNVVAGKRNLEMKRIKEIHSHLAIWELGMQKIITQDVDDFTDIEVIARGFVTKTPEGGFRFIHRTFAEYFIGEAICAEILKKNFNLMKYINDHWEEQIPQFAYLSILDKAQKGNLEFYVEVPEDYKKILKSLYFSRKSTNEQDFAIIIEFIAQKLTPNELVDFLSYQFQFYQGLTQSHINFLLDFLQEICDISDINQILSLLGSKNFTDKKYFLTSFQNLLITRKLHTYSETFEKIYTDFGTQYKLEGKINLTNISTFFSKNTNYSKDIHFAVFENRKTTIEDDVKKKIMSKYEKIDTFEAQDMVLMNYLTLYLEETSNFLRDLLKYFFNRQILMKFFTKLSRIHFNIDDTVDGPFNLRDYTEEDCTKFIQICIKIFIENQWEKENFDGKTLIFYCWTSDDILVMTPFLQHLPEETILNLTASPNFEGKSAIDYYYTSPDAPEFPLNYLEYLYKKSPRKNLLSLIVPLPNPKTYLKNISLYNNLFLSMLNNVIDEETYNALTTKIIEEIAVELENDQINVLYPFACYDGFVLKNHSFIEEFFEKLTKSSDYIRSFGERKNYYMHCLKKINENGDNLLHIAAKNDNSDFLEYLFQYLSNEDVEFLVECLKVKNSQGKNYFHCAPNSLLYRKSIKIPQKDLTQMLLDQDQDGRTPFHRYSCDFFITNNILLTEDDMITLLELQDKDNNNILHYIATDKHKDMRELRLFLTLLISPKIKGEIRKALLVANKEGKTPKDLGFINI